MSSIQSFLKQRNPATSIIQAPDNDCYYIFVAGPGNYVGNYPPGYMQLASVNPALIPQGTLLRDMGKTIKAPIGTNPAATAGFFQEVQFIAPQASNTFGVGQGSQGAGTLPSAGNAGDAGYGTYYLATVIDGTLATSNGTTTAVLPIVSTVPAAPTITRIVPGDGQLAVYFTPGSDGGSPITDHHYSVNDDTFTTASSSPVIIRSLSTTSHRITMRSRNVKGFGLISAMVSATPAPEIPNLSNVGTNGGVGIQPQLHMYFNTFHSYTPIQFDLYLNTGSPNPTIIIQSDPNWIGWDENGGTVTFTNFANLDSYTNCYIILRHGGMQPSAPSRLFYFTIGGASGFNP